MSKLSYHIVWIVIFSLFGGLPLLSQEIKTEITIPDTLTEEERIQESIKLYRAILDHNPYSSFALSGLGKIRYQQEDWGAVKENFSKILKVDENNLESLYYLGVAYRETGKFKALLLRKLDWDKSKKYFEKVIEQDSSFEDVLYQYAKLKRYRGKYRDAILFGQHQISYRPDLVEPQVKIFRLYRYFIDHEDYPESANWLQAQNWPQAQFALGEVWRKKSEFDKADSIFQLLLNQQTEMPIQPVLLALCRIYAEQNLPQKVDSCFWVAVNLINNKVEADLVMEDLKYLLTEEEYDFYRQTASDSERIDFFERFWLRRNPLPAAPWNVRVVEHYTRINFADKNYDYDGFRGWFADPDELSYLEYPITRTLNDVYNDKGIIYLRHGSPNETARTAVFEVPINESWLYFATPQNPQLTFHFILGKSGNDWRFSPIIDNPAILQDRLTWGTIYYSLLSADPLERLQYEEEMAILSQKSVTEALTTDRHSWPEGIESFNFPISIETFRGDSGLSRIDISYIIPAVADISEKIALSNDSVINIEQGLALLNNQKGYVKKELSVRQIQQTDTLERIQTFTDFLPPDTYTVAIHLDPLDFNILGGYKFSFALTDYSGDELSLSDIQLANRIEPGSYDSTFIKEGVSIWPNPAHEFNRISPVFIYFEIYNLYQNEQGLSQFSVEYNLTHKNPKGRGIGNLFGLLGGGEKTSISIKNERQSQAEYSSEYLALDVSQLQAGDYLLEITVTDELSKSTIDNQVELTLD